MVNNYYSKLTDRRIDLELLKMTRDILHRIRVVHRHVKLLIVSFEGLSQPLRDGRGGPLAIAEKA